MKKYDEAVKCLDSFVNYEKKGFNSGVNFHLGGMRSALRKMGLSGKSFAAAHIAGTKGKGSVSTFTASILSEAGMRTGLYTSPHLLCLRERITIDGKMISERAFSEGFFYLMKTLEKRTIERLTYFEVLTLIAMWFFAGGRADAAVFETGLGGRLDATNVLSPLVCGITPISYDHTRVLGRSLRKIAGEKAAIIKKNAVCVSSRQEKSVLRVIKKRCVEVGASLVLADRYARCEIKKMEPKGTVFDIETPLRRYSDCYTVMPGEFQVDNAAVAVAICERMWHRIYRSDIDEDAVKKGIAKTFLEGRMEMVSFFPRIIVDGAQNAASAETLAGSVSKIFSWDNLVLIAGFCDDKDIKGSCAALSGIADTIIVTQAPTVRAAKPEKIVKCFNNRRVIVAENVEEALDRAICIAGEKGLILAAGSFYIASEVKRIINRKNAE